MRREQMPEPPQLTPLDVEEQRLYSELMFPTSFRDVETASRWTGGNAGGLEGHHHHHHPRRATDPNSSILSSEGEFDVSVKEGDSVSLNSGLTEIKDEDVIQWRFEFTLIAEIYKRADRFTVYDDVLDGRFRDRLKLDNQTGSLTITNTTTEHEGDSRLVMSSGRRFSSKVFRVYNSVHCCGSTEAVIRLVLSAMVGVATVIILVYDIRSRRAEGDQEVSKSKAERRT